MAKIIDGEDFLQALKGLLTEMRHDLMAGGDGQTFDLMRASSKAMAGSLQEQKQLLVSVRRSMDAMATRGKGLPPRAVLIKSLTAQLVAADRKADVFETSDHLFNKSARVADAIRNPLSVFKAVTNPAMTTVSGWAAELMQDSLYAGLIQTIAPTSVYAALGRRGLSIDFGRVGSIRFVDRPPPASVSNVFCGEGQPLPVRQLAFITGLTLQPFKAGAISLFSSELAKHSTPAIETAISRALSDDLSVAVDSALLDDNPASTIRPAGLLYGVTPIAPSAATNPAEAAAADIANLAASFDPPPVSPVLIVNGAQAVNAALLLPGFGALDVIQSDSVAAHEVIMVDAADFVSISAGDGETDTTGFPSVISNDVGEVVSTGTSGPGAITAAPHLSLFQQALIGCRVIESIGWGLRRANRAAVITGTEW